tara:strand:+ start:1018 stop:2895 length:1878 start_codon:yes stop_codon:yes gene_type:complete
MVPFNKLVEDPENVRTTRSTDGIEALADNIQAEGLLQNLVVRKTKGGKFAVSGGERRRRALGVLISRKQMKATDEVPCKLISDAATSASLSENIHREAMHPADQFAAWAKMQDEGLSVSEIATRHGATTKLVEQRLKLGRLSPALLDALRADEIDVEAACAFTITDDAERQEAVFEALKSHWQGITARGVKAALTEDEIADSNKLARLIGREAYEADGGEVRTDLFGDTVYFKDAERLTRLATAQLEAEAERLQGEGWAWIEIAFDENYYAGDKMRRIHPKKIDLSDTDQAEKTKLEARYAELEEAAENDDEKAIAECDDIEAKLAVLEEKAKAYKPKEQAIAGGFLSLAHDGTVQVKLGFIRAEDDPKAIAAKKKAAKERAEQPSQFSKSLRDDLAAIRLEVLQAELLANPIVARDLLAFHTIRDALSIGYTDSPFELSAQQARSARVVSKVGDMGRYEGREKVEKLVAGLSLDWFEVEDETESFEAFRALSEADKIALQAYAAVYMLKPQLNDEGQTDPTLERAAQIIGVDVASYWTPDAEFFGRITKGQMEEIATEVIDPEFAQRHQKDKKGVYAEAMGNVFNPEVKTIGIKAPTRKRLAAWVPECMTVQPVATPAKKDKAA